MKKRMGLDTQQRLYNAIGRQLAMNAAPKGTHTQGPWHVDRTTNGDLAIWNDEDRHLLSDEGDNPLPRKEREANALAMSAAPDLLAAADLALLEIQQFHSTAYPDCHKQPAQDGPERWTCPAHQAMYALEGAIKKARNL